MIDPDLLKKFISGKCTKEEEKEVRDILLRPEGRQLLENMLDKEWTDFSADAPSQTEIDEWQTAFEKKKERHMKSRRLKSVYKWSAVAAAACLIPIFIFILPAGQLQFQQAIARLNSAEISTSQGETTTINLADGTSVFLGPESRLTYPKKFDAATREVSIEGEAFFDVAKNPAKPFIVHTGDVSTKVLGTSFKVNAHKDLPLSVSLVTGKVELLRNENGDSRMLAALTPGKRVDYDAASGSVELSDFHTEDIARWKEGQLIFRGSPFNEIRRSIESWYGVRITVENPAWENKKLQLFINGKNDINEALETIRSTTGWGYKITGKDITIYEEKE